MKKTLLIAIAQANSEPWTRIWKEGQDKTWINFGSDAIPVVNVQSVSAPYLFQKLDSIHEGFRYRKTIGRWQGRVDKIITKFISKKTPKYNFNMHNQILMVESWSLYFLFGRRAIALYDWFLKNRSEDFLFCTNTSSYVHKKKLLNEVQKLDPSEAIYAGYLLPEGEKQQFVSGAGRLLSRKSVELLVNNWEKYSHEGLEDVSHGRLMKSLGVPALALSRVDLPTPESVAALPESVIQSQFHFRCKSTDSPRKDVEIMRLLHERVTKAT
jgi:hypothetical protein